MQIGMSAYVIIIIILYIICRCDVLFLTFLAALYKWLYTVSIMPLGAVYIIWDYITIQLISGHE